MNSGLGSVRAYAMSVRAYAMSVRAYAMSVRAFAMSVRAYRIDTERHLCVCTACTPLYQVEVLGTKGRRTVIFNTKNVAAHCVGLGMMVSMT